VLIDLHCHTLPLSQCSSLRPEELADLARERGLDGVCLTEHDASWDTGELEALNRRTGFLFLPGIELTTDVGHVLAYGLGGGSSRFASARAAAEAAKTDGGLLFLAHPARDGLLRVTDETSRLFASVETRNGSDTALQNLSTDGLVNAFRLPGIGGSDAHTPAEAGRAATHFDANITDIASLLAALRSGAYEAVAVS
jgi:predicted metal-dependent phosphoesterase TrpH